MEETDHCLVVGSGADELSRKLGCELVRATPLLLALHTPCPLPPAPTLAC